MLELLNKVCVLGLLEILLMRTKRLVRFGFYGSTVQVVSRGDQVSFYTTVGGVVYQFVKRNRVEMSLRIWLGA